MEIDHEIDAQSIYGWEQMPVMRRPPRIDRTISVTGQPVQAITKTSSRVDMRRPFMERSISHVVARMPKIDDGGNMNPNPIRRWFESGSIDSIHLSSSVEIFGEKVGDRESKKSMFPPNALKIVEKEQEILDKLAESKKETDALTE